VPWSAAATPRAVVEGAVRRPRAVPEAQILARTVGVQATRELHRATPKVLGERRAGIEPQIARATPRTAGRVEAQEGKIAGWK